MIESIGNKLNEIISPIVPFFLSEAETSSYPFCVYNADIQPFYSKDGIYRYRASVNLNIVSNDFDEADTIANAIIAATNEEMTGDYSASMQSMNKDCSEGIWAIEINYIINQR